MTKVSIVILNWNRYEDTFNCLKSLKKIYKKNLDINIIVVDNGSKEEEVKKIKSLSDSVKIILNSKNLGFAEGNNIGIRASLKENPDYILVLNNDTEVHKNFLIELVNAAQNEKDVGAFTPKIYFAKGFEFHKNRYNAKDLGKVIWSAGGIIDWDNVYGSNRGVDEVDSGQFDQEIQTDFATGACVLFRASALKRVGIFDSIYFMYIEDADLSLRLKKKNYKIIYVPKSVIWHKVAQSSGIGSSLNDYFITRNRLIFGFRYANLRAKIALTKEAIFRFLLKGNFWQRIAVIDFAIGNLGKGSWK